MVPVAADRLDVVVQARMLTARAFCAALAGMPMDLLGLSVSDAVTEEMMRLLAAGAADLAVELVGLDTARDRAVETLQKAWSDWIALHAPVPDLVPAGWPDNPECLMGEAMYVSLACPPPARRCDACTGELPPTPPILVDQLSRRCFCDDCGIRAGYRARVARLRRGRSDLAAAGNDYERILKICRWLIDQ